MMQTFTGKEYVQIDIANQFGLNKLTWDKRIEWVEQHEKTLEELHKEAKCPVLYRKAVRAFRAGQLGIPVGYIMGLDATSSGLQIDAALTGCKTTAERTNLIDTSSRENVYQYIADEMSSIVGYTLDADTVKKPIMTVFYGSTRQPESIFGKGTTELQAFYTILGQVLPGAMALLPIMQESWNPRALEHGWIMPDRHVVRVPVIQKVDVKIPIATSGFQTTYTFRTDQNIPKRKGLSLAANIIQSIDAYIAREMIRRGHKLGIQIASIHDSFWAHPNHMNEVRRIYIEIMAEIAESDLLEFIINQIRSTPVRIKKFSTDLGKDIRQANYALS